MSPGWGMSQAKHGPSLDETRASGCRGASPQGASEADPAPGSPSAVWHRAYLLMLPMHWGGQGALGGRGPRRARSGIPARGAEPARCAARRRRLLERRRPWRGGAYCRRQPAAPTPCDLRGSGTGRESESGACGCARSQEGASATSGPKGEDAKGREIDEVDSRDEDTGEEDEAVARQTSVCRSSLTETTTGRISIGLSSGSA